VCFGFQAALGLFGEQAFEASGYGFGGYFGGHFHASAFGEQFGQLGGGDLVGGFFAGAAADFVFPFGLFGLAHGEGDGAPFGAGL
jgi:hypothetical protein